MASYKTFTTARPTAPDPVVLADAVRTATSDPTAVLHNGLDGTWLGKKLAPWSTADITATQNALDTAVAHTPQRAAQYIIDGWPIETRALLLTLLDQLNVIRSKLIPPLSAITPAQAVQAVRDKAGS